ncbi:hypothetical protein Tco_0603933 [Tanacetum coccineum]
MAVVAMSVVYVLTTLIPEDDGDDPTVEQVRKRNEWDNDDYVCRGLILKDFKHTLKHLKEELTLVELGSHLRIEESLRMQDSDKPKNNNVAGLYYLCDLNVIPSLGNKKYFVTFIDDASRTDRGGEYMDTLYFQSVGVIHEMTAMYSTTKWVPNKRNKITPYELWTKRKPNLNYLRALDASLLDILSFLRLLGSMSLSIMIQFQSIIELKDAIFDENRLSFVPRPSLRIPNGTEDIGGSVVFEEVTEEVEWNLIYEEVPKAKGWSFRALNKILILPYAIGDKLSWYTSNPGTQHLQAIQWVLKYLKKTMDYRLTYTGYPSVLEGYTDASKASSNHCMDNSSIKGWIPSWQLIRSSMVKNLLLKIPLWVKPIAPISIRYDSASTLAKAYKPDVQWEV